MRNTALDCQHRGMRTARVGLVPSRSAEIPTGGNKAQSAYNSQDMCMCSRQHQIALFVRNVLLILNKVPQIQSFFFMSPLGINSYEIVFLKKKKKTQILVNLYFKKLFFFVLFLFLFTEKLQSLRI